MTMCVTPIAPEATLRLTVSKATAVRHLKLRIDQGLAIRRRRVRYLEDLEEVRAEKSAWVQSYTETLRQMFHGDAGTAVADACNDWVGRVYPEYADMELFVEQFYEDMDYRIGRLRAVVKQIAGLPDPAPVAQPAVAIISGPEAQPAPSAPAPVAAKREKDAPANVREEPQSQPRCSGLLVAREAASCGSVEHLLKELGIDVLTVPAAPLQGKQAIAAMERNPEAAFAILLLGPADAAAIRNAESCPGAVTFQLGYLVGRLGLSSVCVLAEGATETFLDPHGIVCLPLDAAGGWHLQLARHLKRAGVEVDLNKLC